MLLGPDTASSREWPVEGFRIYIISAMVPDYAQDRELSNVMRPRAASQFDVGAALGAAQMTGRFR
jgi:hypothetical protein